MNSRGITSKLLQFPTEASCCGMRYVGCGSEQQIMSPPHHQRTPYLLSVSHKHIQSVFTYEFGRTMLNIRPWHMAVWWSGQAHLRSNLSPLRWGNSTVNSKSQLQGRKTAVRNFPASKLIDGEEKQQVHTPQGVQTQEARSEELAKPKSKPDHLNSGEWKDSKEHRRAEEGVAASLGMMLGRDDRHQ